MSQDMVGIGLGAAAFAIIVWVDLVSLKGLRFMKPFLWMAGTGVFVLAVRQTILRSPRILLPPGIVALGCVLAGVSLLLLVYSLVIEIPFFSAYLETGSSQKLVTRGTYALCRHPGVLWLAGVIGGAFLSTGALYLAPAFVVWMGCDLVLVFIQERFFFARLFGPEYRAYQEQVPMVVPTPGSIARCIRSFRGAPPTP